VIKKIFLSFLLLILLAVGGITAILIPAHQQIDALNPPFPSLKSIRESAKIEGLPVSIEMFNTATQMVSKTSVLSSVKKDDAFEMSYPTFLITWENGQQFLIDAGMTESVALAFGKPLETLGAGAMKFHGDLKDFIDPSNINGIGFTHLHEDHVDGVRTLCPAAKGLVVVQGYEQFSQVNYGTSAQNELLDSLECGKRLLIRDNFTLKSIAGFPGLYLINVAGHTPGSQVFVVHVKVEGRNTTYILAGDLANHIEGIESNISKPVFYSRFIVPENLVQLDKARIWLKQLDAEYNINVLISHHKRSIDDRLD